ncbi:hypothetical protein, partial [Escherichia coli]|uniref:hypothetical protein n=1 Tax=Escherichia coli TaxID=562 RepID=UPI0019567CEB
GGCKVVVRVEIGFGGEAVVVGGCKVGVRVEIGFVVVHVGTENHTGEFSVHGDERVTIDNFINQLKFRFNVRCPNFTDQDRFRIRFFTQQAHLEFFLS